MTAVIRAADDRLSGIYGTVLFDDLGRNPDGDLRQRNVTVFADGEVDRSPCGSGTASRVALLSATGALGDGRTLVHESIVGTIFRARIVDSTLESFVFEVTGSPDKLRAFMELMRPLGLVEVSRAGVVAMARGSKGL